MEFGTTFGWFEKSFAAGLCAIPILLIVGVLDKHYNIPSVVTFAWYGLGILLGFPAFLLSLNIVTPSQLAPSLPLVLVALLGFVLGAAMNILMGIAIGDAPNAGLPSAVSHGSLTLTYLLAPALFGLFPSVFAVAEFSVQKFVGILIILIGAAIVKFDLQEIGALFKH